MRRGLPGAAALLLLAAPLSRAFAQPPPAGEAGEAPAEAGPPPFDRAAYDRWIDLAVDEFAAGHHREALAAFRRAHEVYPNARALRGMAMSAYELRDYAAALLHGEAALASDEQPLTPELRAQVRDVVERSRAFVAVYRLELDPPGAALRIDGAEGVREPGAGPLVLGLGEHRLRVTAPGFERLERTLTVVGGEDGVLRLSLVPEEAPAPPPAPRPLVSPTAAEPEVRGGPPAGALVLGGGVAAALAALGGAIWVADRDGAVGRCRAVLEVDPLGCGNLPTLAGERDLAIGLTVAFGAAGLGLLSAGLGLLLGD